MMNAGRNQFRRQAAGPAPWGTCVLPAIPTQGPLSALATGIAIAIGDALASMRTIVTALASRWYAAGAGPADAYAPKRCFDGYLPRHLRRHAARSTRRVERAVVDAWLMWRR
jgi:hypothetical protein